MIGEQLTLNEWNSALLLALLPPASLQYPDNSQKEIESQSDTHQNSRRFYYDTAPRQVRLYDQNLPAPVGVSDL